MKFLPSKASPFDIPRSCHRITRLRLRWRPQPTRLGGFGPCDGALIHRLQEMLDAVLSELAAAFDPLLNCFAKMKPDEDA